MTKTDWQSKMQVNHNLLKIDENSIYEVAKANLSMENTIYGLSKARPFTTIEEKWGEEGQHQYIIHSGEWNMNKGR